MALRGRRIAAGKPGLLATVLWRLAATANQARRKQTGARGNVRARRRNESEPAARKASRDSVWSNHTERRSPRKEPWHEILPAGSRRPRVCDDESTNHSTRIRGSVAKSSRSATRL